MAKFRALVSKFPYNIIFATKKVCSSFLLFLFIFHTKQMKKFLIVQNKKTEKAFSVFLFIVVDTHYTN